MRGGANDTVPFDSRKPEGTMRPRSLVSARKIEETFPMLRTTPAPTPAAPPKK